MQDEHCSPADWRKELTKKQKKAVLALELSNPHTPAAAVVYYKSALELDDTVELAHCVILSAKLYEQEKFDLTDTEELDDVLGDLMDTSFDLDNYMVDERSIVQAMDFNLFVF